MKTLHAFSLAAVAAAIFLAPQANAQDGRIVVLRFRKTGDTVAIRNAQITIDHTIDAGVTDSLGIVRVPDLEDGGHIVEAVAKGYQALFDKFTSGPTIKMPIDLEIPAVVVTAKAKGQPTELRVAGFDQRRVGGQGKFFTPAQLKAADGRPLTNFLKVDAAAFIVAGPQNESFLASRAQSRPSTPCYASVVRDGLRLYPYESAAPPDLDKIFTDDLGRIELYATAAAAPAELRAVSTCGALILWSR